MSEAAERVEAWRREKRKAGYRPVLLWLSIETKSALDALAYRRHQDPSSCVADAVHALAARQGLPPSTRLDIKQVERLIESKLAHALASQPLTSPPPAAPEEAPLPLPAGFKRCGNKDHAPYPANKKECPTHVRERKKAARERKAAKRRGEVPT
jgi:hypothetical protein